MRKFIVSFGLFLLLSGCGSSQQVATLSVQVHVPDHFKESLTERVGIRGSKNPLKWDQSIFLEPNSDSTLFSGTIKIPLIFNQEPLAFKFIHNERNWELESFYNRRLLLQAGKPMEITHWFDSVDTRPLRQKVPGNELLRDLKLLDYSLRSFHPGLFLHLDSTTYVRNLTTFEKKCTIGLTPLEFYQETARFLNSIQCSHTWTNTYNQQPAFSSFFHKQWPVLPFHFKIIGNQVVVTGSGYPEILPEGSVIRSINGVPVNSIIDSLIPFTRADGSSQGKRFVQLGISDEEKPGVTDIFLPFIIQPDKGMWLVEATSQSGHMISSQIPVAFFETRNQLIQSPKNIPWKLELLPDRSSAILSLSTFAVWQRIPDWKGWLDSAFTQLHTENIQNLIIDIRENEGGADEVIGELTQWILKTPINFKTEHESRLAYQSVPDSVKIFLSTWDPSFYDRGASVKQRKGTTYFVLKESENPVEFSPKQGAFTGKVWLLTGPQNSSATHHLARIWKKYNLATLVGEETGGNLSGATGGQFFFLHLPFSGVEVDIPLILSIPDKSETGGVKPDWPVSQTVNDYLKEKDTILSFVQEKIGH